jgi:hypothetical protein
MKVLQGSRLLIYQIASAAFSHQNIHPSILELGVLDGANAWTINKVMRPEQLILVDAWSTEIFEDFYQNNRHRNWVDDLDVHSAYFNGSVRNQSTFDELYKKVVEKFLGKLEVKIIRSPTRAAMQNLIQSHPNKLDFIYVDASHQYETVLDDLMYCSDLLQQNGLLQLNDCCHSLEGVRQNLGVLEATVKFCKLKDFIPVLLTNTDYTDVLLMRRESSVINLIDRIVTNNSINFVEIPHQLLGALNVRYGNLRNLSFV